jgi:hypothetical protein
MTSIPFAGVEAKNNPYRSQNVICLNQNFYFLTVIATIPSSNGTRYTSASNSAHYNRQWIFCPSRDITKRSGDNWS